MNSLRRSSQERCRPLQLPRARLPHWLLSRAKKLTDLTADTDDKDLINTLGSTLGMIDNPPDTNVRKRLLKYLPTKYHKDVKAQTL